MQTPADDEGRFPEGLTWHATDDPDHYAITCLGSLQSALYVSSDREWYAERTVKVLEQFADLATGKLREPPRVKHSNVFGKVEFVEFVAFVKFSAVSIAHSSSASSARHSAE